MVYQFDPVNNFNMLNILQLMLLSNVFVLTGPPTDSLDSGGAPFGPPRIRLVHCVTWKPYAVVTMLT